MIPKPYFYSAVAFALAVLVTLAISGCAQVEQVKTVISDTVDKYGVELKPTGVDQEPFEDPA